MATLEDCDLDFAPQDDLCDEPLEVVSLRAAIILMGPRNVALAMTITAAEASLQNLHKAIGEAKTGNILAATASVERGK